MTKIRRGREGEGDGGGGGKRGGSHGFLTTHTRVEIRNFTQLRQKKYFARNHFRFVIFSLFLFRLIQKCLKT